MNPTCLIVDDHDNLRNLMCDWLESIFPNIDFISAATGEEALALVNSHSPQVVIMDIGLPGISGIQATRQIKREHPHTIVIIHTIHDDLAYHADAALAGADVYIAKSTSQSDLVSTLNNFFFTASMPNNLPSRY